MADEAFPLRTLLRAFPGIPVDEARTLIRSGAVRSYPAGAVLCHEDAIEATFYILLEGVVKVTKRMDAAGVQERLLKTLNSGDFFGEMALIQEAPRAATVTTVQPSRVLEIYKEDFEELLSASASLSRALMQEVVSRLRANDNLAIEDLRIKAGELAVAYQKLAEQDYARRQFLTTIAHELRTPLTAAGGFLQMTEMALAAWKNGAPPPDDVQLSTALHTASRNIEQIISLVNDILFVQEMDLILPRFEAVDLAQVVQSALPRLEPQYNEQNVQIDVAIPEGLPALYGDALSLERAVGAVLNNAVKFSLPGGRVEVLAGREVGRVWLEVSDHGVGIPEQALPHIFERFFHLDEVDGQLFRGAGLGLSIARQVIDQHGGELRVHSCLGEGTRVRFELQVMKDGQSQKG
jgi:signal transduction histidine kinase